MDSVEYIENTPTSYSPVIGEYVRFKFTEYVVSSEETQYMAWRSIVQEIITNETVRTRTKSEGILVALFRNVVDVKTARTCLAENFYYVCLFHKPQAGWEMILKIL